MKKFIVLFLFLIFIAVPATAENDEPQKYQVDFTLRYNAVDVNTMAKILTYLEQLKKQAGSVKLKPCKWNVKVKPAEENLGSWVNVTTGTGLLTITDNYITGE